jgi:phage terminase small subunit
MRKLTDKQKAFCREYPKDLNGAAAAKRAGYSKKTARQIATENLSKPYIQEELAKHAEKAVEAAEIEVFDVLNELKTMGFSNVGDYLTFGPKGIKLFSSKKLTKDQLAAISEVSESISKKGKRYVRFKLHSKAQALEMLAKYLELFKGKEGAEAVNVHIHYH